jgi:hypothetical protein
VGIGVRWYGPGWPVGLEALLERERTREQNTLPLPVGHVAVDLTAGFAGAGVFKASRRSGIRPFGGGGIGVILYRRYLFDNDVGSGGGRIRDGGAAPGAYAGGGASLDLGGRMVLGFEVRAFAGAGVGLSEIAVDPGAGFRVDERRRSSFHRQIALRLGWRWRRASSAGPPRRSLGPR